mmetsp:Transcript_31083/g.89634  ORF Transcript_31083/g.89634 Transcript_31083/m.89634 type:complete len:271 (+) Transcript_31083:877-1689(+)
MYSSVASLNLHSVTIAVLARISAALLGSDNRFGTSTSAAGRPSTNERGCPQQAKRSWWSPGCFAAASIHLVPFSSTFHTSRGSAGSVMGMTLRPDAVCCSFNTSWRMCANTKASLPCSLSIWAIKANSAGVHCSLRSPISSTKQTTVPPSPKPKRDRHTPRHTSKFRHCSTSNSTPQHAISMWPNASSKSFSQPGRLSDLQNTFVCAPPPLNVMYTAFTEGSCSSSGTSTRAPCTSMAVLPIPFMPEQPSMGNLPSGPLLVFARTALMYF